MKCAKPPLPVPSQENEEDSAAVPADVGTKDKDKGGVDRGGKSAGGKDILYRTIVSLNQILFHFHIMSNAWLCPHI